MKNIKKNDFQTKQNVTIYSQLADNEKIHKYFQSRL